MAEHHIVTIGAYIDPEDHFAHVIIECTCGGAYFVGNGQTYEHLRHCLDELAHNTPTHYADQYEEAPCPSSMESPSRTRSSMPMIG